MRVYPRRAPGMIRGMNSVITREPYIAGYPDRLSYLPGEEVAFACSTSAAEFSAGTTDWSYGLDGHDPIVERITRNVLDRLLARSDD